MCMFKILKNIYYQYRYAGLYKNGLKLSLCNRQLEKPEVFRRLRIELTVLRNNIMRRSSFRKKKLVNDDNYEKK